MIKFTQDEINKNHKEVQDFYKKNLANKIVKHPIIGDIIIYNAQFGETRHWVPSKYLPILFKLPEILKTATTNGKLALDKGKHSYIKNLKGFYYLYNDVLFGNESLNLKLDIMVLSNEQKYYMFSFSKNEDQKPDSIMSETDLSGRGMVSNNIITESQQKGNPDNPKVGDVFWLGDSMRIEVIEIKPDIKELNNKLKEYLEA